MIAGLVVVILVVYQKTCSGTAGTRRLTIAIKMKLPARSACRPDLHLHQKREQVHVNVPTRNMKHPRIAKMKVRNGRNHLPGQKLIPKERMKRKAISQLRSSSSIFLVRVSPGSIRTTRDIAVALTVLLIWEKKL